MARAKKPAIQDVQRVRQQITALAQPYPKRAASIAVMRSPLQAREDGATPIAALQFEVTP